MQTNPFSTRFIQPGAISYHRFDGGTLNDLAVQFLQLPTRRGIIVGPHGSGKSTLIASLETELRLLRPDSEIYAYRLSSDGASTSALRASFRTWKASSIVIIDGFEQLSFWSRMKVAWKVQRHSLLLLVTAHAPLRGFETLWQTAVDAESSHWVVHRLLDQSMENGGQAQLVQSLLQSDEWNRSRTKHGQNLRESLFDMYDWWQAITARG
jgi:energy-coupling factor transporter ATP-binding protein EcfA2